MENQIVRMEFGERVELFGSFAGIAQQYLFYYEREQNKRRK